MKRINCIIAAIICIFALASCSSTGDSHTVTEQAFTGAFAHVDELTTGASATYTGVGYKLTLDYTNFTASLDISGLKTTDGVSYPRLTLKDMPWTISQNNTFEIKAASVTPVSTGLASVPAISSFEMKLVNRYLDGMYYMPGYSISFTLNGSFKIFSANPDQVLFGKTTSTSQSGSAFETETPRYDLNFNVETNRLKITIVGAQFIKNMPAMNITLENIPFTYHGTNARWSAESVIPKIDGAPFEAFAISNLEGELDFSGDFELKFDCAPATMPEAYKVEVEGSYLYYGSLNSTL